MIKEYVLAARGLLRVPTYLLMLLYYTVAFVGAGTKIEVWAYAAGALAIAAWYINATALNDLSDFEIDRVNLRGDPDRPLLAGTLAKPQLLRLAVISGFAALALVAPFGWRAETLLFALIVLNAAYSLPPVAVSRRGGLALALLPVGYVGLTMTLGALSAGVAFSWPPVVLIAICYVQFLARISLKDYRDVVGDAKFGKRTFLLRHGSGAVTRLALMCHIAAGIGGAAWLYAGSPVRAAGYVFLAAVAGGFLARLPSAHGWQQQRILIASYGRIVSGQLTVILLAVLVRTGYVRGHTQASLLLVLLVATFAWSAQRIARARVLN